METTHSADGRVEFHCSLQMRRLAARGDAPAGSRGLRSFADPARARAPVGETEAWIRSPHGKTAYVVFIRGKRGGLTIFEKILKNKWKKKKKRAPTGRFPVECAAVQRRMTNWRFKKAFLTVSQPAFLSFYGLVLQACEISSLRLVGRRHAQGKSRVRTRRHPARPV